MKRTFLMLYRAARHHSNTNTAELTFKRIVESPLSVEILCCALTRIIALADRLARPNNPAVSPRAPRLDECLQILIDEFNDWDK